jgi:hypothetical protein
MMAALLVTRYLLLAALAALVVWHIWVERLTGE